MLTQGSGGEKIIWPRSQEGREKKQSRGFGTQKPQILRGLVASCSHLCIKHGHRAVEGHSKYGSQGQPANWRMCLGEERNLGKGGKRGFSLHVSKKCILHRAKGKIRTIQGLRHCLCCFKFSWQHLTSPLTQRGI